MTRARHEFAFSSIFFVVYFMWPHGVSSQDTIRLNIGASATKYILCPGETSTLTINSAATQSGFPTTLTTEHLRYNYEECRYTGCTVAGNIIPTVTGSGVVSNEVIVRQGCGTNPNEKSVVEIVVKPSVTTVYHFFWTANLIYSADPLCGDEERIIQTKIFEGSIEIKVVDSDPPIVNPTKIEVNQFDNPQYLTASAYFVSNFRSFRWYISECDGERVEQVNFFQGNTATYSVNTQKLTVATVRVAKLDNGCLSDISAPVKITVKPCNQHGPGCHSQETGFIESQSCDPSQSQRQDYHLYSMKKQICQGCDIDTVWDLYKSDVTNQAIVLTDQLTFLGRLLPTAFNIPFSSTLLPEGTYSGPITDCQEISLPRLTTFMLTAGAAFPPVWGLVGAGAEFQDRCAKEALSFSDPIFLRVNENARCVTNYTGKDHILYPGKVTRCLVEEECGSVSLLTFGEGTTQFQSDPICGQTLAWFNKYWGESMFTNVNDRFYERVQQRFNPPAPAIPAQNPQLLINTASLSPIGDKTWKIERVDLKYPGHDSVYNFYQSTDSGDVLGFRSVSINFSSGNLYYGVDADGNSVAGTWNYDSSTNLFTTDTTITHFEWSDSSTIVLKGNSPVIIDTAFAMADFRLTLVSTASSQYWTGKVSTAWENPANWSRGFVPDRHTSVIVGPGNSFQPVIRSNVNVRNLTISPLANLKVETGYELKVGPPN